MWRHSLGGLLLALALLFAGWDSARSAIDGAAPPPAPHERGRAIYNYRCYFCHGYSGDARTLAATYLQPAPRDFTTAPPLARERIVRALREGRPGTAMKSFAGLLDEAEIEAVAGFVEREFMREKAPNTRYHTAANGWPRHERYAAAFPFARGELALDTPAERLTAAQRDGRALFLGSCVSCHDRARVDDEGPVWCARPVSFPRRGFVPGQPNLPPAVDAVSSASVYARHEIPPPVDGLPPAQRRGAALFQANCAFCHGGDGTGRNWIGQFMEPHARDLTQYTAQSMPPALLRQRILEGLPGTSMPAWQQVLAPREVDDLVAFVSGVLYQRRVAWAAPAR